MEISNFDQWVNTLSTAVSKARGMGMSDEMIRSSAVQVGNYLYANVDPDIPENRVLRAMWEVADEPERQAIASTLVKLCDKYGRH
ncbi:MAG: DUF3243 domain-containing protein [Clostridia bacterium]|nr:DUF3243 domain-containing protein [Clostridia bacterium]MDH7573226.1 DUF3243 domain-containing protein [Clostridia bacterium]